jgi:hypothetical protein
VLTVFDTGHDLPLGSGPPASRSPARRIRRLEPSLVLRPALRGLACPDEPRLTGAFSGETRCPRVSHPDLHRPESGCPKLIPPALHPLCPCPDRCHPLHVTLSGGNAHRWFWVTTRIPVRRQVLQPVPPQTRRWWDLRASHGRPRHFGRGHCARPRRTVRSRRHLLVSGTVLCLAQPLPAIEHHLRAIEGTPHRFRCYRVHLDPLPPALTQAASGR